MTSWRAVPSLLLLALAFCCSVGAGSLLAGPQRAAADETSEGTTTTEPPPVVETPTEPEKSPETPVTPPSETPVTTPPAETPSVGEGGTTPVEIPKAPVTGSGSGSGGGGGGGGSNAGSGSSGSTGSSGIVTTAPSASTGNHTHRVRIPSSSGGGGSKAGATGGGGSDGGSVSHGGGHHASSPAEGGHSPPPTVSPTNIDEGAQAVSHVAAHVGEVFAAALPTAPLKEIGTRVATHVGLVPAAGGQARKHAVERIGTALGAALIGSAVAVDRAPAPSHSPIPFFDPPGGKSGTIYLVLIAALLLAVGALLFREVRTALGLNPHLAATVPADGRPRSGARQRVGAALAGLSYATERWFNRFRRFRSHAVAGLRSLF